MAMQSVYPDTAIIIFAREPVPGKVKTRLIPVLGANNAARLYEQMLKHTINIVVETNVAAVYFYITPESDPKYFLTCAIKHNFQLSIQQGSNLGERMFNALDEILINYKRAVLIGTDCPFLDANHLHQAIMVLDTDQALKKTMVFTPALDGGYVLVGASLICREVFNDIEWGTDNVMSQTRSALQYKQIQWQELTTMQDIDSSEDLPALSQLKGFRQWSINNGL